MTRIRISPDLNYHGSISGPLHYSDAEVAEGWAGDDDLSVLLWLAARETTRLCHRLLAAVIPVPHTNWATWSQP